MRQTLYGMRKRPHRMQQRTLSMWLALTWRLILAFPICPAMGQASASATSSSTFLRAITDPTVSLILIPPDNFELIPDEWAAFNRTHPYVLDRNLTIRSSAPPELGQMDFRFLTRRVLLAEDVMLRMEYLVLRNINKLGGFGVDFFMGDLGSVISITRSVRVKFVCPPPEQSLQAANAFSAPVGAAPNSVDMVDGVCVLQNKSTKQDAQERKCYDDAIKFHQFTLQVGSADPDVGTSQPGYRLQMQNVTRVCDNYVTAECIQRYSEDMCTAELLSKLLTPPQASDGTLQPQTIAGVVAGGVVGFLAVCSLIWFLLWKHAKWWAYGNGHSGKGFDDEQLEPLADDDTARQMNQSLLPPVAGGRMMDPSQAVKLGVLLGSGSFGRVYKGRWHGMDVAVKIMDPCTPDTLPRVLKEAEVMMGLSHQNVVKAYQCSVWSKKQQEQLARAAESRKATGARRVSDGGSPRQAAQRRQLQAAARRSSGSASLPSSSTTASQGVSSSSMAGSLHSPAATGASAGASTDGVVINIIPEFVSRNRAGHAAGSPAFGGASTSTSSTAAGTRSSASHTLGAHSSGDAPGLFASAARLWKRQQHELPDHSSQGPPTGSRSFELQPRTAVTPLSSAAYTLSGSSSVGTVPAGLSVHTTMGVLSSTHEPQPHGVTSPASASMSQCTRSSGSVSQGTASDALSSQGVLNASDGAQGSSSFGAASGQREIQPAPLPLGKPVMGWLRRPSKRASLDAPDVAPGSDSSSSKAAGSTSAAGSSRSGDKERDEMQVWLVLELCTGGSLKDAVSCGRIRTSSCQELAKLLSRLLDAATGLAYLHKQGVIHGDLKAANVLLQHCVQGSYGQVAKVSDFGVSAQLLDGATHRSTTSLGTITHMAPEVLRSGRLSKAADVYAYGIMMWEVFTNQTAHSGCHSGAVVERVVLRGERPPVPSGMPPQYALLMQRCWGDDPAQRPSFEQIITCIELLLDNLTSSESEEGRISEGVEEERTSSDSISAPADKAAATELAAAESLAAAANTSGKWLDKAPDTPAADPRRCDAPMAVSASSSAAGRLWRLIAKGSSSVAVVDGQSSGKGLAESVEGSSDWLSGPGTPGFSISIEQLRGLKQWCLANGVAPEGGTGPEAERGCTGPVGDIEAHCGLQSATGAQPTPGWRSGRLQPWLDQCVDALSPPVPKVWGAADKQPWPYSRRWLLLGTSKLRGLAVGQASTSGSSLLSQQPLTPHQSAEGAV